MTDLTVKKANIKCFENRYAVLSNGTVQNLNTGKILRGGKDAYGYIQVCLLDDQGKRRVFKMHRLVAEAFIDNPNGKEHVNHIDEDKTNNHVHNLEWVTAKENIIHGSCKRKSAISRGTPIIVTLEGGMLKEFPSIKETARINKVSTAKIREHLRSGTSYRGMTFKYLGNY
ncbi:DNA endonuclease [Enterococcus phage EH93P2]|nr:DNA endonuclease [Enterococcus phage EH93P1]WAX15918.1 DNA endonuclease [Enterococcus phage EH93P2]